jgi:formylmethanofuran dehydrogenase subunit E
MSEWDDFRDMGSSTPTQSNPRPPEAGETPNSQAHRRQVCRDNKRWPECRVVRVDKSPMNPKIKVAQLSCGHDVYRNRAPRVGATIVCERCAEKANDR